MKHIFIVKESKVESIAGMLNGLITGFHLIVSEGRHTQKKFF